MHVLRALNAGLFISVEKKDDNGLKDRCRDEFDRCMSKSKNKPTKS